VRLAKPTLALFCLICRRHLAELSFPVNRRLFGGTVIVFRPSRLIRLDRRRQTVTQTRPGLLSFGECGTWEFTRIP
jgi:hypothetical protein